MFREILQSLSSHKGRTLVAVLTVAWGVFMLVMLLGTGRGLQNGVELQFADDAVNTIWVHSGKTRIPHAGIPKDTPIQFHTSDYELLKEAVPFENRISGSFKPDYQRTVTFGRKFAAFEILGVLPDHLRIEKASIRAGRFLNSLDVQNKRKVVVIGEQVKKTLFGKSKAVGEYLLVEDIPYMVIGVFSDTSDRARNALMYLPLSTAQSVYNNSPEIDEFLLSINDPAYESSKIAETKIRQALHARHNIHPDDRNAVQTYNNLDTYKKVTDLFFWIGVFVALVGVGTVITGLLTVSNIMLVSVSERRNEIGVRKAIGATPASITAMIVFESFAISVAAGALGMTLGLGLLELLQATIEANEYMYQPEVDPWVILVVMAIIVVAGTLSGYLPAKNAAAISPREALIG